MKVVILTSTFSPTIGGAEVVIAELSNALHNLGVDVTIIAPRLVRENHAYNAYSTLTVNVPVKRIRLIRQVHATLKFGRSANVVHAHFLYPSGFVGLIHKYFLRKPCVVTMHGADIQVDKSTGYGKRIDWRLDLIIKFVLRNVDVLIAPSKLLAEEAIKAGADPSKVHIIPNGVDISRFNPSISGKMIRKRLGIGPDEHVVLTISRFHPKKGHAFLVKAIPMVLKEFPDTKFVLCGEGPEKQTIINMVKSLGLFKNVLFAGFIDEKEKPMYYAAADVFALPSLVEGAPIVILEALASGKPLVASRTGNIPELVRDGVSGILVNPQDTVQIAKAIIRYLENPSLREIGGITGREEIVKNYSWETIAKKTLALYERLL